jgi:hypothetical protein
MDDRFCLVPSKVQIKSERGAGKAEKIVLKKFKHGRRGRKVLAPINYASAPAGRAEKG